VTTPEQGANSHLPISKGARGPRLIGLRLRGAHVPWRRALFLKTVDTAARIYPQVDRHWTVLVIYGLSPDAAGIGPTHPAQRSHLSCRVTHNRDGDFGIESPKIVPNPKWLSGLLCVEGALRSSLWVTCDRHFAAIDGAESGQSPACAFEQVWTMAAHPATDPNPRAEGQQKYSRTKYKKSLHAT
jgi:hypothetical protein